MVRAIEIETGVITWSGSARLVLSRSLRGIDWYPVCVSASPDLLETELTLQRRIRGEAIGPTRLTILACHALAMAWGLLNRAPIRSRERSASAIEHAVSRDLDFLGDVVASGRESKRVLMTRAPCQIPGCGWLRICVFSALFCRDMHP